MTEKLNVYDLNLKKVAILQNAINVSETKDLNKVYSLSFDLPNSDPKNEYCNPYWFARWGDYGDFYRFTADDEKNEDTGMISYECEHAVATLIDDIMWGTENFVEIPTETVLRNILNRQTVKHWELDICELSANYEYLWTQENLLNAIYSIPKPWTQPYIWSFDFSVYPWKLSLKKIDSEIKPEYYIRAKKNLLDCSKKKSHLGICTRLYALGYGEGVNQLTIKEVNGGIPYVESPTSVIEKYGIISRVFVDRSIEDAETLLARTRATLVELQEPALTRSFNVIDLYPLTNDLLDDAEVGKMALLVEDGTKTYITKTTRVLTNLGDLQIDLSTKSTDIADSIAELSNRQRIESTYSQGATQLYSWNFADNASSSKGLVGYVYFPSDLRHLNGVKIKVKLDRFRYYTKNTESAGSSTQTSSSGGGSTSTSSANGGGPATVTGGSSSKTTTDDKLTNIYAVGFPQTQGTSWTGGKASANHDSNIILATSSSSGSTDSGGGGYTSDAGGSNTGSSSGNTSFAGGSGSISTSGPNSSSFDGHSHSYNLYGHTHSIGSHSHSNSQHSHWVNSHSHGIGSHSHSIQYSQANHTHDVIMPWHNHTIVNTSHSHGMDHTHNLSVTTSNHTHSVSIPSHSHDVDIPSHSHTITNDVYENSTSPTTAGIYIGDVLRTTVEDDAELDITSYLLNEGRVPRDRWIKIELRPNGLAYCQIFGTTIAFIQSYAGGNY